LVDAYAQQVALLDRVLGTVEVGDWRRADPRHRDMRGVVAHLTGNDAMLAADLGLQVVPTAGAPVPVTWRAQAEALLRGLEVTGPPAATEFGPVGRHGPVRLASIEPTRRRPLHDGLVQRAFETWTHRDDLVAAIGLPPIPPPPPEQVRRIVDLAVRLLPDAWSAHGVLRPGPAARLVLTGAGGGEWTVPLGGGAVIADRVEVTISCDAVEFSRLVANRRAPDTLDHTVTGDAALGAAVLRIAATLGCD
jgi:hypothetical protein